MLGNEVLAEALEDLLSRSSLISLMYQSAHSAEQSQQEHVQVVDAIEQRDARAAARLMAHHLDSVERNLRPEPSVRPTSNRSCVRSHDRHDRIRRSIATRATCAATAASPPQARWPGQARVAAAVRAELRGRRRELGPARRRRQRAVPVRDGQPAGLCGAPSEHGEHLRIRLARRCLAHPARIRAARPAADRVRRRHGAAAMPGSGRRLRRARSRSGLPWLALDQLPAGRRSHRARTPAPGHCRPWPRPPASRRWAGTPAATARTRAAWSPTTAASNTTATTTATTCRSGCR